MRRSLSASSVFSLQIFFVLRFKSSDIAFRIFYFLFSIFLIQIQSQSQNQHITPCRLKPAPQSQRLIIGAVKLERFELGAYGELGESLVLSAEELCESCFHISDFRGAWRIRRQPSVMSGGTLRVLFLACRSFLS